jgi:hypothetical protein
VVSSDLYDRGYGEIGVDFLTARRSHDNIITNPPFNSAEGYGSATKNAMVRLGYLRHNSAHPPTPLPRKP